MAKQKKSSAKNEAWIKARKRYHLSHAHVQMARELGMDPKKLGSLANHKQEPWKAPLPEFIESLYWKRFKKSRPDNVRSLEQMAKDRERKEQLKKTEEKKRQQAARTRRCPQQERNPE